jgi:hypothetical protein
VTFDRIKALFARVANGKSALSSERGELGAIIRQIKAANKTLIELQDTAANLAATVTAGTAAQRELHALVASPSGAAGLADFSAGRDKGRSELAPVSPVSISFDKASRAVQSADVARHAIPIVEKEIAQANAEIARLEGQKKAKIQALLIQHGDWLGQKYREAFEEFCHYHDQIVGFARGSGCTNVVLTGETIEVPRFNLPSLAPSDVFSPFLRHVPNSQSIAAASIAWSRFAGRLATDPQADVSAELQPDLADQVGRHPEHGSEVKLSIRERHEPDLNEVLYGEVDRPRRHKIIG